MKESRRGIKRKTRETDQTGNRGDGEPARRQRIGLSSIRSLSPIMGERVDGRESVRQSRLKTTDVTQRERETDRTGDRADSRLSGLMGDRAHLKDFRLQLL